MKYPQGCRDAKLPVLEAAASNDASRPILTQVFLRIEKPKSKKPKGWLEATDSYCLVRLPVELDEGDTEGMIPAEALKQARKAGSFTAGDTVVVEGEPRLEYKRVEGQYPNVPQLIPESETQFTFGVDVDILARVGKALGTSQVRVSFTADAEGNPLNRRPLIVRPCKCEDERVALVMPREIRS